MLQKPANLFSYIRPLLAGLIVAGIFSSVIYVLAAPPDSRYDFAETLTPACVAGSTNCTVVSPARSGANSDITGLTGLNTQAAIKISPFSTSSGNTGEIRLLELAANGENYTGFKAANSITANVIWTLPSADGTSNQVLTTNGSGVLSWATVNLSGYVPYTGASSAVDLGAQTLTTTGTLGAGATTVTSLDAGSGAITTTGTGTFGIGKFTTGLHDASNVLSIDPYNRYLMANSNTALSWTNDVTRSYFTGNFYADTIFDSSGNSSIDGTNRYLYDASGYTAVDWSNRKLYAYDGMGTPVEMADWSGYSYGLYAPKLSGGNAYTAIDIPNALITSWDMGGPKTSIDWYNRILYANDGTDPVLNWATAGTANFGDSSITTTGTLGAGTITGTSLNTADASIVQHPVWGAGYSQGNIDTLVAHYNGAYSASLSEGTGTEYFYYDPAIFSAVGGYTSSKGILINSGGITVTNGNITIAAGNLVLNSGSITGATSISLTSSLDTDGDVDAGDWLKANTDANAGIGLHLGGYGTAPQPRGGMIEWENYATVKGYTFVNNNGQIVFDTTKQASTTDTGNAWIDLDDGSASFGGHTLTIGATGDLTTTGTGTFGAGGIKILESGATPTKYITLKSADLTTADRTFTFPDSGGTIVTGSGTGLQIALWSGANTLSSSPEFTFEEGDLYLTNGMFANYVTTTGTGTFSGGITTKYAAEDPMLTINGQIAVSYEGTAPRIRFVANGTEYYIDKTGGFGIPGPETFDPISGDKMEIGDVVLGMINQNLGDTDNPEDSSLHGIWVKWDSVKAQLLAEARGELAASGAWGSGQISGVSSESMVEKIKNVMVSFGMSVEGTLLRIKDLVVEKFSAKTARIEKLEMVDSATGQIYCTWIQNGEWKKTQGECASAFVANTVPEEVVSTNEAIVLLQKDVSSLVSQLEQVQSAVSEVAVPEIVGQLQEDISSLASDQAQSKSTVKKLEKELQGLSEVQEQVEEVVSEQEAVSQQLEDISANQEQVIEQQEQLLEAQPGSVLNSLKNLWSGISPARLLGSLNNATQWLKDLFTF